MTIARGVTLYPLAPLLAVTPLSDDQLRRSAHISGTEWTAARQRGLTVWQADRAAIRSGYHPSAIWPNWYDDTRKPCDHCGTPFVPERKDGRFCSRTCYRRAWDRELKARRREDPAVREKLAARRRAYYAENGAYERARERRAYNAARARHTPNDAA